MLLSGCDMVTTLMNAQQLHMIKAVKTSRDERGALQATSLTEELLAMDSLWAMGNNPF